MLLCYYIVACEYGWVAYGDHCYMFRAGQYNHLETAIKCSEFDSYVFSIETQEEVDGVLDIAKNISKSL